MKLANPNTLPRGSRRFVAYWLQDIAFGFQKRGFRALVPLRFLVCATLGSLVGYWVDDAALAKDEIAIALYAAVFTVDAILMAICWGAFSRIYDILAEREFGAWLRRRGADGYFNFYIEYIHFVQMLAILAAAAALLLSLTRNLLPIVDNVSLGVVVGSSTYAGWWATGCVRIMQDLTDHRATFTDQREDVEDLPRGTRSR